MSLKQDGSLPRTAEDLQRRYKLHDIKETSEKVKEIEQEIEVDSSLSASSSNAVENRVITAALANKVNVVEGKDLSTNDFTDGYKNMLDEAYGAYLDGNIQSSNIAEVAGYVWYKNGVLLHWATATEEPTYSIVFDTLIFATKTEVSETEFKYFAIGYKSIEGGVNI